MFPENVMTVVDRVTFLPNLHSTSDEYVEPLRSAWITWQGWFGFLSRSSDIFLYTLLSIHDDDIIFFVSPMVVRDSHSPALISGRSVAARALVVLKTKKMTIKATL